jgi:hypothetical protein
MVFRNRERYVRIVALALVVALVLGVLAAIAGTLN